MCTPEQRLECFAYCLLRSHHPIIREPLKDKVEVIFDVILITGCPLEPLQTLFKCTLFSGHQSSSKIITACFFHHLSSKLNTTRRPPICHKLSAILATTGLKTHISLLQLFWSIADINKQTVYNSFCDRISF